MNIRVKIGTAMILLSLVVSISVSFFANIISRDIIKRRSEGFLTTIVNEKVSIIDSNLNSVNKLSLNMLDEFKNTFNFKNSDPEYISKYLDKFELTVILNAEQNSSNSAFFILFSSHREDIIWYEDNNYDGIPNRVTSNIEIDNLLNIVKEEPRKQWVVDYDKLKVTHINCVYDEYGNLIAVVGMNLKLVEIIRHIYRFEYLNSGRLLLTTENKKVVFHPEKNSRFIDDVDITIPGVFKTAIDENGEEYILSSFKLFNNWVLTIFISKDDLYSELDRITLVIIILVLVSIVGIFVFSLITSRFIADPYKYLTSTIESIGKGNYDISIDKNYFRRTDEVGILSRAIKEMVKLQKQSFQEIQNNNINLEKTVESRTQELQMANSALEEYLNVIQEKQKDLTKTNDQLEQSLLDVKETRKELIKAEKIASSRYIAIGIAHNMNTPLGNIVTMISYLKLLKDELFSDLQNKKLTQDKLNAFLENINEVCYRIEASDEQMKTLIKKLRSFSEIKTKEDFLPMDIGSAIEVIVKNFIFEHGENLPVINVKNSATKNIKCNAPDLHKVIYELIDNSIIHGLEGVKSPTIDIEIYDSEKNGVGILYKDNGIGVKESDVQEVFTPLFTTKLGKHSGLGLAMVHHIVIELLHGEISLKSHKNAGTEILIKFFD